MKRNLISPLVLETPFLFSFGAKNIISLQIKAHEIYIKPFKPRESILEIKQSDEEDDYESDNEVKPFDEDEENVFED